MQFPVGRIKRMLKKKFSSCAVDGKAMRVRTEAAVYMAGVLEYLMAEMVELGGNQARDMKKHRITPQHINLAVRGDQELDKFLKDVVIPGGGVRPNIQSALLPKKKSWREKQHADA